MRRYGSRASNLTGLLGSIGDTIGEMGKPGEQYIDTFRRSMAPEADLNSSESLLNYSEWAKRNGYDDEAEKYLALGYKQKAAEGEKSYKDTMATSTETLRSLYSRLGTLQGAETPDEAAIAGIQSKIDSVEAEMNQLGESSAYGVANAGSVAGREVVASMTAAEKAALDMRNLRAQTIEQEVETQQLVNQGSLLPAGSLPYTDYEKYKQRMEGALTLAEKIRINKEFKALSATNSTAKAEENRSIASSQVAVLYGDLLKEGKGFINDDELTDFLEEIPQEARELVNGTIVSYAMADPRWRDAKTQEEQDKVIKEIFVREYSRYYKEGFKPAFGNREAGKEIRESDAEANYEPGMNPEGSGKQAFDEWYANELTFNPEYTMEEAREDWDMQFKRTSSTGPKVYRKEKGIPGLSDAYNKADANYNRFLENMERRRAENANR